jgi:hypothetical protein
MSRSYQLDLEVSKKEISEGEFQKMERIFENEWGKDIGFLTDDSPNSLNKIATFSAEGQLCGGESEDEAHKRIRDAIKKEIGKCKIKTRWTYLEELPYEEYID